MVITRSGTATKPIGKKPDKKFLKEKERPSSFEADFAAILNDSEDDEMMNTDVFSSDSGAVSDLSAPYQMLNGGPILQRSGSFQLNRRHRRLDTTESCFESSFESTRDLISPSENRCKPVPTFSTSFSPIAHTAHSNRGTRVFDSPGTPRSLVRRLSQNSASSPRWQRKGVTSTAARQRRTEAKSGNDKCIVNPFLNNATSTSHRLINETNKAVCHSLIHNGSSRYKKEFVELAPLGTGEHGDVLKVRNRFDGMVYAIKKTRNPLKGSRQEIQAIREVCAHACLGTHENVVRYYSAWCEDDRMLIQFEYCNGTSLHEDLIGRVQRQAVMSTNEMMVLVRHTASGLAFIHAQQLAHMDIKPGNIFRCLRDADSAITYKIGDLGLVCPSNERIYDEGDCRYVARELIEDTQVDRHDRANLCSSDVFSLGMTLFEAATLVAPPKNGATWQDLRSSRLIRAELDAKSRLTEELKMLIVSMTVTEPGGRPRADQLLRTSPSPQSDSILVKLKRENQELKAAYSKTMNENRVLQEKRLDQKKLKLRLSTA